MAASGKKQLHRLLSLIHATGMNCKCLSRRQTIEMSNGRTPVSKTPEGHGLMTILFQLFAFLFIQNLLLIFSWCQYLKPLVSWPVVCVDKFIGFSSEERAIDKAEWRASAFFGFCMLELWYHRSLPRQTSYIVTYQCFLHTAFSKLGY